MKLKGRKISASHRSKVEKTTGERHWGVRVAEGIDEGEGGNERASLLVVNVLDNLAKGRVELPVLDHDLDVVGLIDRLKLAFQMLNAPLVMLNEEKRGIPPSASLLERVVLEQGLQHD